MTDIGNWDECIVPRQGRYGQYALVPMNEYQMNRLLVTLAAHPELGDGDWWAEVQDVVREALHRQEHPEKCGCEQVANQ